MRKFVYLFKTYPSMKKLLFVFCIAFIWVSCEKDNTPQETSKRIKGVYEVIGNDTIPKEEYSYVGEQLSVWKRYTDGVLYATANLSYEGNMVIFDWMDGNTHVQLDECDFTDGKLTERRFYEIENSESFLRTVANYTYEDEKLTFYVQKSSSEGVMKISNEYSYAYHPLLFHIPSPKLIDACQVKGNGISHGTIK